MAPRGKRNQSNQSSSSSSTSTADVASDVEVGEPSFSGSAGARNPTSSSRPVVESSHRMLQSQIVLLERQLLETRRLLHRQQVQQPYENPTEIPAVIATSSDACSSQHSLHRVNTPLHCNGKLYYGTLNDPPTEPLLLSNNTNNTNTNTNTSSQMNSNNIPSEIRMTRGFSEGGNTVATAGEDTHRSGGTTSSLLHHMLDDAVSIVRSEDEFTKEEVNHESEFYLHSSVLERAFPERQFALFVTLLFELPVLFMISGGSDKLCALVGRSKYQLLMAFLPLTSAISGNVGLQASTLTTRAISHNHVTTSSYMPWFLTEVGAAFCLALGMGTLLGSLALYASGWDIAFALTIFVAQVISIVTAGCTGTFAPLLFSFIFRRDSGKWGGPLETAVQDIVGSFAMVVISYKILQMLGPHVVDPSDQCGGSGV